MPEDVWEQCCFNITEGGLGLRQHGDVSQCAFVASLVESLPTIERYSPNFSQQLDTSREQSLVVRQFRKALRFINRRSGESFSVTNLDEVKSLLASKRHDETLQGILMAGMSSVRLHAFVLPFSVASMTAMLDDGLTFVRSRNDSLSLTTSSRRSCAIASS